MNQEPNSKILSSETRFGFGKNWKKYLASLTPDRINRAKSSLQNMLGKESFKKYSFVDIGSGSGLFSLAAWQLGARVHSFDFDQDSVECTMILRSNFNAPKSEWSIERASILDEDFVKRLGQFDIVYSWGVLHHTGNMQLACEQVAKMCNPDGLLFIAIYNSQGVISHYWWVVKWIYNTGLVGKYLMTLLHIPYLLVCRLFFRAITGRLDVERGMSIWFDMHDWLGGMPFEVASAGKIEATFSEIGFTLVKKNLVGSKHGCNEFVFRNCNRQQPRTNQS